MKTRTIPPLRVSSQLRRQAESVLREGETLSAFMLDALRTSIARRIDQDAFLARGLASAEKARRTGRYVSAGAVLDKLEKRLGRKRGSSR
jgi:hypothetical protein